MVLSAAAFEVELTTGALDTEEEVALDLGAEELTAAALETEELTAAFEADEMTIALETDALALAEATFDTTELETAALDTDTDTDTGDDDEVGGFDDTELGLGAATELDAALETAAEDEAGLRAELEEAGLGAVLDEAALEAELDTAFVTETEDDVDLIAAIEEVGAALEIDGPPEVNIALCSHRVVLAIVPFLSSSIITHM